MKTTVGQLLVNDILPDEYKDYERSLTGDNLTDLLANIGRENPELYKEISQKLMQMGAKASYTEGTTISIDDLATPDENIRKEVFDFVDKQEDIIRNAKDMTEDEKQVALSTVYSAAQKKLIDGTMGAAVAQENPLALQILSKARGNPGQLTAITASPGIYTDAKDEIVPLFVRRSYAEGLSPAEYYAATFGTRKGVIATKFATRDAGDFGKQLNTAAADLIVTEEDCGTSNGIPVGVDDKDSVGALLAKDVSGYKADAAVDSRMLNKLDNSKYKKIVVRSPITCQAKGGVCKKCVGLRENGKLPELRQAVGIQASSALAERIAQGSLNTKHAGGQASGGGEKVYAGFPIINQIGQIPKTFRHKATLADVDGEVSKIEQAPQGGTNVYIGDEVHYIEPEQEVNVKEGDEIEAGDQLSTGIVNPAEVVKYKGIGEGRRYYAERLTKAFNDSKLKANRRNTELVARAAINHVEVEEPEGLGDYLPGDVVSYNNLAMSYAPRKDAMMDKPSKLVGKFLEQPYLHHTIGSRITKKVAKELEDFGIDNVQAHETKPGFTANMIRLRAVPHYGKDWLAKLQGSYLQSNLLQDAQTAATSDIHGTHPVPAVVYGKELGESKRDKVTF